MTSHARAANARATTAPDTGAALDAVLAIFAHPDDAELACGATLAGFATAGRAVWVVSVCRGDKGSGQPVDPDELAERRAAEGVAAAAALGAAGWATLGWSDGAVDNDAALREALVLLIRQRQPTLVITSDPTASFFGGQYVNHRDHRSVGWAVLDAVAPAAANPNYFPAAGPPHSVRELWLANSLEPDHRVDVSAHLDRKAAAVICHRSQLGVGGELELGETGDEAELIREMLEARAEVEGRSSGHRAAEAFRRLVLSGA